MSTLKRFPLPAAASVENRNIGRQYAVQKAAWIWHPEMLHDAPVVLELECAFGLSMDREVRFHVSADERYELFLDGRFLSMGPDRSDLEHWSFASFRGMISAGDHLLRVVVWRLGADRNPAAQVTWRGGFIFKAEGLEDEAAIDTGTGAWRVREKAGVDFYEPHIRKMNYCLIVGPSQRTAVVDEGRWRRPAVVLPPVSDPEHCGVVYPGWCLYPTSLPEQLREKRRAVVRAVRVRLIDLPPRDLPLHLEVRYEEADCANPDLTPWQRLIDGEEPLVIAAEREVIALLDLGDYICGYPVLSVSGGEGSEIQIEWAESLYESVERPVRKGNRGEIVGKRFIGFDDAFLPGGEERQPFTSLWWRAGRYIQVRVRTSGSAVRLLSLGVTECRYPYIDESRFASNDPQLERINRICIRGIQCSAHETYTDTPYYEQMMYVGDARLEMLVTFLMTSDDRLIRRGIELFDWSRWKTGFTAERYPSAPYQLCLPFSMIWILMVEDYALWRDDPSFISERLFGIRSLLECFRRLLSADGLLRNPPGWPWVDWAESWPHGVPPGVDEDVSSVINLLLVLALLSAARLEAGFGEEILAERNHLLARGIMDRCVDLFWKEERGLVADRPAGDTFSEHAQVFALLSGLLDGESTARLLKALEDKVPMERMTVYSSFYLLEVFRIHGRGDLILDRLAPWRLLERLDLKTPVEDLSRTQARSDCHAWGSHPVFHFHASLCGIRPEGYGFRRVIVRPNPGSLTRLDSGIVHPAGRIEANLGFSGGRCTGDIRLPPGVPGVFRWNGAEALLAAGDRTAIDMG